MEASVLGKSRWLLRITIFVAAGNLILLSLALTSAFGGSDEWKLNYSKHLTPSRFCAIYLPYTLSILIHNIFRPWFWFWKPNLFITPDILYSLIELTAVDISDNINMYSP
ncbi:hypothetical protein NP233_g230 [Leucocoprinus birnbaumii]|uniref:Uncharacterized protein n=1 Tax=Leucocoprinus birnbaumii TaxID=56174 RepID=A0AAD5YW01_9AGAR|nr:hypothetical protein NP233_g230 [Leucocoprinus birnbaumii]